MNGNFLITFHTPYHTISEFSWHFITLWGKKVELMCFSVLAVIVMDKYHTHAQTYVNWL